MTNQFPYPVEQRIERVLRRLDCQDVRAVCLGGGKVALITAEKCVNTRALVMAATKTVPGVTEVSIEVD